MATGFRLSPEVEALGAAITKTCELELADCQRWQRPLGEITVTTKEAYAAVKAWAAEHQLDAWSPKVDARERERRKALVQRAIRKHRPFPVFSTVITIWAWRSGAWL